MARRAQSASPNKSQHETKAEERWWKTPAVIAAVIAALAAISVAIINQRTAPKPRSSDIPPMQQQTHSPDSPAIVDVPGSVTVTKDVAIRASSSGPAIMQTGQSSVHITNLYGISKEEHARLSQELGVTDSALKSFFKILAQQQVPREDLDSTLRDIAQRYQELQDKLRAFTSNDPAVTALKRAASKALDDGDFAQTEKLLNEASEKDIEAVQQLQETATKRWLSAAASKAAIGRLKETQLQYAAAVTHYREAAELIESIPKGLEEILAMYLTDWGVASYQAGDYRSAELPLTRALAIGERALGPEHPNVATGLENYAALLRATHRTPEADELEIRAKTIRAKYARKHAME